MQYIEASVVGVRSAVITFKRRVTPLRFVLIPMVHVAEPEFYREVASLAGQLILRGWACRCNGNTSWTTG